MFFPLTMPKQTILILFPTTASFNFVFKAVKLGTVKSFSSAVSTIIVLPKFPSGSIFTITPTNVELSL